MQRIRYAYECTPDHIRAGVTEYNKQSITFDNGSRIVAQTTTENTGRGMSISLVYLDEFAFVEPRIAKEFWTSLSPTLSTGGKCLITSTPNTDEDQFAEIWFGAIKEIDEYGEEQEVGVNGFKSFFATYECHPDRDDEWAKVEAAKIGDERFRREHKCEFISFDEVLINPLKLAELKGITPIRTSGHVRWYDTIKKNYTYIVTLDPAMGTGGDNAAIEVWELPTLRQVGEWQHNKTPVEGQMRVLKSMLREIQEAADPEIYWTVESNTLGEACLYIIRDTGEDSFPGTFMSEPNPQVSKRERRKGFLTTNKSKIEACAKLKQLVESDKMQIRSKNLISELKTFAARANSYMAREGDTDDLVMSTLLFVRAAQYIATFDDMAYNSVNGDINDYGPDDYHEPPMPIVFC